MMTSPMRDPPLSPRMGYAELGVSPQTTTIPQPRGRESSPATPVLSEDSFGNPLSGRSSRRTSGAPLFRRPNSFLFASPLGTGMTTLPSQTAFSSDGGGYWNGRRSRATSGTAEFGSLRPLIRQLSSVGVADGKATGDDESGTEEERVPPMIVSPSDAPPSAVRLLWHLPSYTLTRYCLAGTEELRLDMFCPHDPAAQQHVCGTR